MHPSPGYAPVFPLCAFCRSSTTTTPEKCISHHCHFATFPLSHRVLQLSISRFSPHVENSSRDPPTTRFERREQPSSFHEFLLPLRLFWIEMKKDAVTGTTECLFNQWRNFLRRDENLTTRRYSSTTSFGSFDNRKRREQRCLRFYLQGYSCS